MNFKYLLYLGLGLIFTSLIGMVYGHEFTISEGIFIVGIIIAGIAYAKGSRLKPEINADRINKNIQILNDTLWGKQETKQEIKLTPEQYWQIRTQSNCMDLHETWGGCYCYYGGRRGYCIFERCPRRIK